MRALTYTLCGESWLSGELNIAETVLTLGDASTAYAESPGEVQDSSTRKA